MANLHDVQKERIICRLFLRDLCMRGDVCPYYHPDYDINPDNPSISWLNFCEDFQRGQCFQRDCRYFHVTEEEEETYRETKDIPPTLLEQAMRKALLLDVALTGTRATCQEFLQSGCSLPLCPYRHISRHEFATEVLNTLRNEFEILLGPSGTDIPGSQTLPTPPASNRSSSPPMSPMMQGMGRTQMQGNVETPEEKRSRLERENEVIYRALDPNQKVQSLEEVRMRLLTLQAALQWKDENDANKEDFMDSHPPGMAVRNYGYRDYNVEESNNDLSRSRDQGDNRPDPESDCKLFIGGLDKTLTKSESLSDYFSRFGEIVDAVVLKGRGFGFVTFTNKFMADNALKSGPHKVDGKVVDAKYAADNQSRTQQRGDNQPRTQQRGDNQPRTQQRGDNQPRTQQRGDRAARSPNREDNRVKKLFIGGVTSGMTREVLLDYFSRYGRITDCISVQDKKTKRPRYFGYVEFEDEDVAQTVLDDYPHRIMGITVTVAKAKRRDAASKGGESGNVSKETKELFVGGLDPSTTEGVVKQFFSRFGKVLLMRIHRDSNGVSKGYGFLKFSEPFMVELAISNGPHKIDGRKVVTGYASKPNDSKKDKEHRERQPERHKSPDYTGTRPEEEDERCSLYIGKFPSSLSEDAIERYFMAFGGVRKVELYKRTTGLAKRTTGLSFGFVTFDSPQMVEMAIRSSPHEIDGCSIEVGRAHSKEREDKNSGGGGAQKPSQRSRDDNEAKLFSTGSDAPCQLYVGGLTYETTGEDLYDYFCKYGEIVESDVKTDPKGVSRGFAFIIFADEMSVREAIADGPHEIDGRIVKVNKSRGKVKDDDNSTEGGARKPKQWYIDDNKVSIGRDDDADKLFAGNLFYDTTEETLHDYLSKYGEVLEVRMKRNSKGYSMGYAFITFAEEDSVQKALEDGPHEIDGSRVHFDRRVKKGQDEDNSREGGVRTLGQRSRDNNKPKSSNAGSDDSCKLYDACKLYIGNLDLHTTKETIYDYFSKFGEIVATDMKNDPTQFYKQPFAFVTFAEEISLLEAIEGGPHKIDRRIVQVGKAKIKGKDDANSREGGTHKQVGKAKIKGKDDANSREGGAHKPRQSSKVDNEPSLPNIGSDDPCKLVVSNLDCDATEETLYEYFCKYGEILEAEVTAEGLAIVSFAEKISVREAMEDGPHEIEGCEVKLESSISRGQGRKNLDNKRTRSPESVPQRRPDQRRVKRKFYHT